MGKIAILTGACSNARDNLVELAIGAVLARVNGSVPEAMAAVGGGQEEHT